jgi:hypothetical protein
MLHRSNNEKGVVPILILVAAIGVIAFLLISNTFTFKDKIFSLLYKLPLSHAADVTVTVDPNTVLFTSNFKVGVTHMQHSLDSWDDAASVQRGKDLMRNGVKYQNQHIFGFGTNNPWPSQSGPIDWSTLDARVQTAIDSGNEPVITLCCAPDWMKGGADGTTDWNNLDAAPLAANIGDFAKLSAEVAKRYNGVTKPKVTYFQVWNEFKGMWAGSPGCYPTACGQNRWDHERYTALYNAVWDAVKAVRPDAKLGGPYLVLEGTGSTGTSGSDATNSPITPRMMSSIDYWLANMRGADFMVQDKGVVSYHDPRNPTNPNGFNGNCYSRDEVMSFTKWFGEVETQILAKPKAAGLEFWWAEDYFNTHCYLSEADFMGAGHASMLYNELMGAKGNAVSLRWSPQGGNDSSGNEALFTSTLVSGGGQSLPNYTIYKNFNDYFGPGTPILKTTSTTSDLEVLASPTKTMLINKKGNSISVDVNGTAVYVGAYKVVVIDTPKVALPSPTSSPLVGVTAIDDAVSGTGVNQFNYSGAWQHCQNCGSDLYANSNSWNPNTNETLTVNFTGTQIKLYGVKDAHHGIGAVSIDGGTETNIDYYSLTRVGDSLMYTSPSLPYNSHTLRLRVTGNKNTSATGVVVTIDRVDVSTTAPSSIPSPSPSLPAPSLSPTPSPVVKDTTSPTVSITNPTNGSTVKANSKVNITASASDNVAISKVEFYVDGSLKCASTISTGSYACIWSVPGKKGSNYNLTVKAYDLAGNTSSAISNVKSQ